MATLGIGAIFNGDCDNDGADVLSVTNSTFYNNELRNASSGTSGGAIRSNSTLTLTHNTFSGNDNGISTAVDALSGAVTIAGGNATLVGNIFADSVANPLSTWGNDHYDCVIRPPATVRTPMDVNLAKQLIILTRDVGLRLDRILMDPSTGALCYGIEYGYSVIERLRLAALAGDSMTQQPMLVTPGEEGWKLKEAKVGEGVPESWGDWKARAINWETLTAVALVESGADIVVLRHPDSAACSRCNRRIDDGINKCQVSCVK